jgi:hypothetical protein
MKKRFLLAGLLSFFLLRMGWEASGAERRRDNCNRKDRVRIEELNMSPDPVVEGQRVRGWKVTLQFDGGRDCQTDIEIRDREDNVLGKQENVNLRRGTNEIAIRPDDRYQFRRKEHCMKVVVNLEGTQKDVDAKRQFCAQQKNSWTMTKGGGR